MKNICVIGIGYVGLPTAAMFASKGHKVVGFDVNKKAVNALNRGEIIIEEPGLKELVKQVVESGNLTGSTECPEDSDVYIIAVPTPINPDKTADMRYVETATRSIVPNLREGNIVILESTSPPRTVEDLMLPILKESGLEMGTQVYVAHSPERILPGQVLYELRTNSRIVGGINDESAQAVKALYEDICEGEICITTATTAEMCKLMENTFRDVNIALANELAKMSEELGVNAWEVISLANKHPRVNLHSPGPGVGGHCIALDPWFLVEKSKNALLINQGRLINDSMPEYVFEKIKETIGGFNGQLITLLGVTYKPDIDDVRESPIMKLWSMLKKEKVAVNACDPHANEKVGCMRDVYAACYRSSMVILCVNHKEFKDLDFDKIKELMDGDTILDTRNYFDRETVEKAGLKYMLLGDGRNK
ncbi:MAG: nucleotide sugar dehydrogenase [Eubacterium sp.]|nr:nucleotide sugar dehydrogenase [Eubacterium sp.]